MCIYVNVLQQNVVYEVVAGDQPDEEEDSTPKLDRASSNLDLRVTNFYR